ncbi:hypothetical protein Pcinc_031625, partial [Petrolisthes cinctipes]
MNKLKLQYHQKTYRDEEILVNVRDLGPEVKEGDVIEIYHPEDDLPRLLLQIPQSLDDVSVQKDTISIEQSVASTFQLRNYKDVIVSRVEPRDVALELIELTFKDQYLGRSDMWRLKMNLVNTVVYVNKKLEFCMGSIRSQVYEMWAQGGKVACGVVTEDTKVVYRSSTSMVYLFIQMSSEMWDFDMNGDLYFEKAVNGFLSELFAKWKKEGSNHDVTIVLFSRTYYKASSIDDFPQYMRECLLEDYKGRFYEDFYRVAVQNERYDDWSPILTRLRRLFNSYLPTVLDHHRQPGVYVPEATNSPASQGNFLEVLNISLNVFEKHYLDRSFDRTGQVSVVITAGVGVFEVDRELTNITKQRIIDNGVGSDLVCVGEQPLHAVPLLKFHNKKGSLNADDYSMPHTWINLSFYSTKKKIGYGSFVPRIKLPPERPGVRRGGGERQDVGISSSSGGGGGGSNGNNTTKPCVHLAPTTTQETALPNSIFDYDAYDAQVFKLPTNQNNKTYRSLQRTAGRKKTTSQSSTTSTSSSVQPLTRISLQRKLSDPDVYTSAHQAGQSGVSSSVSVLGSSGVSLFDKSPAINIPARITENKTYSQSFGALNVEGVNRPRTQTLYEGEELSPPHSVKVGSSSGNSPNELPLQPAKTRGVNSHRAGRSLINPFDPSHVTIKLTSNRRRWIHIFPKDQTGVLIQQHHYQAASSRVNTPSTPVINNPATEGEAGEQQQQQQQQQQQLISTTPPFVSSPHHLSSNTLTNGEVNGHRPPTFCSQLSQECVSSLRRDQQQRTSSLAGSITSVDAMGRVGGTPLKSRGSVCSMGGGGAGAGGGGARTVTGSSAVAGKAKCPATLLWGATGEQEWTAELTTGVDWKSLILPACLPITTDYFPEDQSLLNDYVVADYNLLAYELDECGGVRSPAPARRPLTTNLIFMELVSQRLAQGFQMIMLGESGRGGECLGGCQRYSGVGSLVGQRHPPSEATKEYRLSIGRIFHKIILTGSTITVTIYRPRHPYPQLKRHYKYRFKAPHMNSYEVSWVEFRTERLETYMWNHLDNYICFRGESPDYSLIEPLKFWRVRMLVVADCYRTATRTIMEGGEGIATDIYSPSTLEEQQTTIEGFLRFMEMTIHRLKRPANARKTRKTGIGGKASGGVYVGRRHSSALVVGTSSSSSSSVLPSSTTSSSSSFISSSTTTTTTTTTAAAAAAATLTGPGGQSVGGGYRERLGSNRVVERPPRPRSSNKVERLRFESGGGGGGREVHSETCEMRPLGEPAEEEARDESENRRCHLGTPLSEVVEWMRDPTKGVTLLQRLSCLPPHTFVSADATTWVCDNVEGVTSEVAAVDLLQRLVKSGLICHASGDPHHPFIHGFFLYFFITGNKEQDQVGYDPAWYQAEWHEVEVEPMATRPAPATPNNNPTNTTTASPSPQHQHTCPAFLEPDLPGSIPWRARHKLWRVGQLDLDINGRSDRIEWGHLKHHSTFSPLTAFELIVQWLCATGTIVTDLMMLWQRRAQICSLHLFPVPSDPFALPYSCHSDPLRGPILIPLNVNCLSDAEHEPFAQFPPATRGRRMHLFQEAILKRFGFVGYVMESHSPDQSQFVHVTGNMFVMVHSPTALTSPTTTTTTTTTTTHTTTQSHSLICSPQHCLHHRYH